MKIAMDLDAALCFALKKNRAVKDTGAIPFEDGVRLADKEYI